MKWHLLTEKRVVCHGVYVVVVKGEVMIDED
jgi:hypothetical protein